MRLYLCELSWLDFCIFKFNIRHVRHFGSWRLYNIVYIIVFDFNNLFDIYCSQSFSTCFWVRVKLSYLLITNETLFSMNFELASISDLEIWRVSYLDGLPSCICVIFNEESDYMLRKIQKRIKTFMVNKEDITETLEILRHHSTLRLCTLDYLTLVSLKLILLLF